ncbi:MAG: T9SS type A sorting domain-containing protein [Ignavibacteria bacterium]|nr:T9SS type A sorting domain-containing protein [Ignavibacteria bacterium]
MNNTSKICVFFFFLILFILISSNQLLAQVSEFNYTDVKNISNSFLPSDQPFASYWFPLEILSWTSATDPDAPYNRSGVALKNKYLDSVTIVNANARFNEGKVNPLSAFAPTSNNPSQGSLEINYYTFSYWQYTDLLVLWGGSAGEGLILAPNPTIIDAAHRNGVKILGNVFFPPIVYGGQLQWVLDFLQKSGNTFPVADKLIEVAEYYGFDGWFINQETQGANAQVAADMRDFMIYFQDNSNLEIEWYDAMTENGNIAWQNQLNTLNDWYFQWGDTLVSETMFLNFWWNSAGLINSRSHAQSLYRDEFELFAGIDVEANGYNTNIGWGSLFPSNQPHVTSLGIYRPDWCYNSSTDLENYYYKSSIFWVGWNHDPSNTTTGNSWKGIANYIPAFTPITDIPFVTNFCTGQGYDFYIDGEKLSHPDWSLLGWNNLSLQDVLPTWRWIVESSGTKLTPEFDFTDAYYGGNCLKVSGDLISDNLLKLYKANTIVTFDSNLGIEFKTGNIGATNLKVALAFESDPTNYVYFDVGNTTSEGWNTNDFDLSGYIGEKISIIALFFEGGFGTSYEIKIGRISIYEGEIDTPNPPTNLFVENKVDEIDYVTLRLRWDHSTDEAYYYNVYRRNPDNSLTYLGGSPNNAYFVPSVKYEQGDSAVAILVQTVGIEFGHSDFAETFFEWFSPPGPAANPYPADGDTNIIRNITLGWTPGNGASSSDIYFGTQNPPPFITNTSGANYYHGILEANTTYYWRINSKNQYYTTEGTVWSFNTGIAIADTNGFALKFDGVDDFLNCGNGTSLQITGSEVTLECWINVNQFKPNIWEGSLIVKDFGAPGNDSGYMIRCGDDGKVNFNLGAGSWQELTSPADAIQLNSWHHIAATYDGTDMKIYVDGDLVAEVNRPSLNIRNAAANMLIGESPGFPGRVFDGKIDEVRIWNVARSREQIKRTMNYLLSPEYYSTPDSGLAGYWRFDEGTGQTAIDFTSFGNNATLGGTANPDMQDPTWVESNVIILSIENKEEQIHNPQSFLLFQNYPNPFNPATTIKFEIPKRTYTSLKIFNVLAKEVTTLLEEEKAPGRYEIKFDASSLSSGVYFYQLKAEDYIETKKMLLLK